MAAKSQAGGSLRGSQSRLPNIDSRPQPVSIPGSSDPDRAASLEKLKSHIPDVKVDFDTLVGSPALISSTRGFLTGRNGAGGGVSAQSLAAIPASDSNRVVRAFLKEHEKLFGHGPEALEAARINRDFVATNNGMRTVVWQQQVDGIAVFESLFTAHTTKNGELVNVSSHFVPAPATAANAGTANRAALQSAPAITASVAVANAAENVGDSVAASEVASQSQAEGPEKHQTFTAPGLRGSVDARLVWLPLNRNSLRLCWQIHLTSRSRGEMFLVLVDAQSGTILLRRGLTEQITNATYRVFNTISPTPFLTATNSGAQTILGFSAPDTNQPAQVSRDLIVTNALSTNASPNGWIDDTNNETLGNNVDAHLDLDADNFPDLPRPHGSPFRVFDFAINLSQPPLTNSDAAVVNVFYWCNWMHDTLYGLGFTESAGNFQSNNFGRGGFGNDSVLADVQDGSQFNFASFSTPADGISGRMELCIFNGPNPDRDPAFDTEVILHEYTHGLSTRRVGSGGGMSSVQARGLGEGWSDFFSLALLSKSGDDVNGCYPEGPYSAYLFGGLTNNYYFGIRRYPYSTVLTNNPLTFKDIDPGQISPHTGVPKNPSNTNNADEIHNQGEVWCVALWDARANLIAKYGFSTGNQLILQLATDGMNLTPANPNFIQARDGVLQADLVSSGGANYPELWAAFAKRGLGNGATSPASSTTVGVVESFSIPDLLVLTPATDLAVADGSIGGPFNPGSQTYTLHNTGTNSMSWNAVASVPWVTVSPTNGTLAGAGGATNVLVSFNSLASNLDVGSYSGTVSFTNLSSGIPQVRNVNLNLALRRVYSILLDGDPGWSREGQWAFGHPTGQGGFPFPNPDPSSAASGANVFGVNLSGNYSTNVGGPFFLTAGPFNFVNTSNVLFQFQRWLNTDYAPYAYATVDISTNGSTWANVFSNGSASAITDSSWSKVQYDISAIADNQPIVYVRWGYRVTAGAHDYSGWNIDDVEFLGISRFGVALPVSATEGAGVLTNQGHVNIPHPAAADVTVSLTSSNTAKVTVPATVIIPAGFTNADFSFTVLDNGVLDGTVPVSISASALGFTTGAGTIQIFDNETATLAIDVPTDATEGDGQVQGTVSMNATPPSDITVTLISSNSSFIQLPASAVIPGGQTSAVFFATIVDDNIINGNRPVTVRAHVANWTDGTDVITIHDNESTNIVVTLPAEARENNGTIAKAGRVTISGTLSTNLVVSLLSSNTSKLIVPPTATILTGQTSAVFNLTMVSGNLPHNPVLVGVSGSAMAFAPGSASINVIDNDTPPAPFNPRPPDLSTTNPVTADLFWNQGLGEGVEVVTNGGFETGTLAGWVTAVGTNTPFIINDGTVMPPSFDGPTTPYSGGFCATADGVWPCHSILYQDITLPNSTNIILSWADRIRNAFLDFDTNQSFRVEIRNTSNVVLAVPFCTKPGDNTFNDWVLRSADISSFRGQTIRLAFVVAADEYYLDVHLDDVSIRCANLPAITYDVYFGTNATPGAPEFQGSTTNTTWPLPNLTPYLTYYWQIVAKRANQTPGPVWQFSTLPAIFITNLFIVEGPPGVTNAVFNVTMSGTNDAIMSVDFSTIDSSAIAGIDYTATNGTLVFNPGDTNQTIIVPVNGNTNAQPNRVFLIGFSNAFNAALVTNAVTGTIVDDDSPPAFISISIAGTNVSTLWTSIPGKTYRLQFITNLLTTNWFDLPGDVTATNLTAGKVDSTGLVPKRFYRVKILP